MNKTSIEWVKNLDGTQGYTLNDKTGCLNCTPAGLCLGGGFPCYAFKLANGRLRQRYLANTNVVFPDGDSRLPTFKEARAMVKEPFYPRFWPERLEQPYQHLKKPVGIFLDDMSDWMGDYWPEEWTRQELQVMRDCSQHRFYTLTKQPQNLIKFSPFPENCWVGVTVTRDIYCTGALYYLHRVEATVKFLSLEPLLMEIPTLQLTSLLKMVGIKWVIIGAQTKPTVYPKIEWVEEIVKACDKAGVKVFLKNNLKPLLINDKGFGNVSPGRLIERELESGTFRLRQEMPIG